MTLKASLFLVAALGAFACGDSGGGSGGAGGSHTATTVAATGTPSSSTTSGTTTATSAATGACIKTGDICGDTQDQCTGKCCSGFATTGIDLMNNKQVYVCG